MRPVHTTAVRPYFLRLYTVNACISSFILSCASLLSRDGWMDGKLGEEDQVLGFYWIIYIIYFTKLRALEKYLLEKVYNGLKVEQKEFKNKFLHIV